MTIVHGSKDEYTGTSLIKISNKSVIYVQTNYRVSPAGEKLSEARRFRISSRRKFYTTRWCR